MRKTERLSRIVQIMEHTQHPVTADDIARKLKASTRTIYRDIAALIQSGIPITGEAGIGYTLTQNSPAAPTMFTAQELEALTLGAHMIKHWSGETMKEAAISAIEKINKAAPSLARNNVEDTTLFYPPSKPQGRITIDIPALRHAMQTKHTITFDTIENDVRETHTINPLCAAFFGPSWMVVGWNDGTKNFQNFKLERIRNLIINEENFEDTQSPTLQDFIHWMRSKNNTSEQQSRTQQDNTPLTRQTQEQEQESEPDLYTEKPDALLTLETILEPDPDPSGNNRVPQRRAGTEA